MVLFFFVVGLEIKRGVVVGHRSSLRLAIVPASASLGGTIVTGPIRAGVILGLVAGKPLGVILFS